MDALSLPQITYTWPDNNVSKTTVDVVRLYPEILTQKNFKDGSLIMVEKCNKFYPYYFGKYGWIQRFFKLDLFHDWMRSSDFGACVLSGSLQIHKNYDLSYNNNYLKIQNEVYTFTAPIVSCLIGLCFETGLNQDLNFSKTVM